jgi:hypothetical protein
LYSALLSTFLINCISKYLCFYVFTGTASQIILNTRRYTTLHGTKQEGITS